MTMKTELDDLEIRAYEGTLSRNRDPVVPRGAVVAGEDRELEVEEASPESGPSERDREEARSIVTDLLNSYSYRVFTRGYEWGDADDLEWTNRVAEAIASCREEQSQEATDDLEEMAARLEELRPVVRAANRDLLVDSNRQVLEAAVDALSPATRAWAEGESEEEGS